MLVAAGEVVDWPVTAPVQGNSEGLERLRSQHCHEIRNHAEGYDPMVLLQSSTELRIAFYVPRQGCNQHCRESHSRGLSSKRNRSNVSPQCHIVWQQGIVSERPHLRGGLDRDSWATTRDERWVDNGWGTKASTDVQPMKAAVKTN